MRKIGMDELRQKQMEVLDYVSSFCDQQGIRYWIEGGTLLGAIRHKGYIPWDDDIDIAMLRKDYDWFRKAFPEKIKILNLCFAVRKMIVIGICRSEK